MEVLEGESLTFYMVHAAISIYFTQSSPHQQQPAALLTHLAYSKVTFAVHLYIDSSAKAAEAGKAKEERPSAWEVLLYFYFFAFCLFYSPPDLLWG